MGLNRTYFFSKNGGLKVLRLISRNRVLIFNEHIIVGEYFPLEKYTIIFTPGEAYADKSLLEVNEIERWVRQEVKIYVTPFDKYNNYIDASIYKNVSPY